MDPISLHVDDLLMVGDGVFEKEMRRKPLADYESTSRFAQRGIVRTSKSIPVSTRFSKLQGKTRIVGHLDASYRNTEDRSSQRMLSFLLENEIFARVHRGCLVHCEVRKVAATTEPITVAELHGLVKRYGSSLFLRLWSGFTGGIADVHIRTDANNLATTAPTTHQPEQKETVRPIQCCRRKAIANRCTTFRSDVS